MIAAKRNARDRCGTCRRVMHVRLDGLLRAHKNRAGLPCSGSHRKPGSHSCGCGDVWSETRTADAVDTVRWPGWLA